MESVVVVLVVEVGVVVVLVCVVVDSVVVVEVVVVDVVLIKVTNSSTFACWFTSCATSASSFSTRSPRLVLSPSHLASAEATLIHSTCW